MEDNNELKVVVVGMMMVTFPDRTKDILKSLKIIHQELKVMMNNCNIKQDDKEIMETIVNSLGYVALNGNLENE